MYLNLILEKSLNIIGACPVGTTVRGKTSMGGMSTNLNSDTPLTLPSNEQGEMLAVFYLRDELEVSIRDLMVTGDNYGIVVNGDLFCSGCTFAMSALPLKWSLVFCKTLRNFS